MSFPKWCLFFDFHTMPANPDVGKAFDFEAIVNRFEKAGVQYVVFPARCNLGVAYYDTKIGIRHPALTYNLLKKLADACHSRGIKLTAYMNLGLSHEEGLRHRDWLVMDADGRTYQQNRLDSFFRQMCYNTGYGDHAVAMVREVLETTGVDGLFLDCMHTRPCFGKECTDAMTAEGVDWNDPKQLNDFNHRKIVNMAKRVSEAARAVKPDCLLYFNGVGYEAQQQLGSYLEFECLPTGGWGYEILPVGARYLRTLGKPVLNMTGRFPRSWGDFGGIRTEPSLEYDCLYGIANGLNTTIGDHFHPRGDINRAVADLDTRIYNRLQKLDPWLDGAKPVVEIAMPMLKPYPGYDYMDPVGRQKFDLEFTAIKGATRMLCELKQQFDIVSHLASWEPYQLLLLPDETPMDAETVKRIRRHLDKGGKIIATAHAGLKEDGSAFAFDEWGVNYLKEDAFDPAFFEVKPSFAEGMPDMPNNFYTNGVEIAAKAGTETLATIVAPYYNRHWDGEHGFVYLPSDKDTGRPAVTLTKQVGYVSHAICGGYFRAGSIPVRQILANLLKRLLPNPLLKAPDAPSFARLTVTSQPGRRMIHYLAYTPESRGAGVNMIEEPLTVLDQRIMLRQDGQDVKNVYLAPSGEKLPFTIKNGYIEITVSKIIGYALVVVE